MTRNMCPAMLFCLALSSYVIIAGCSDLTGTWKSTYEFGPIEESMTTIIQQVGDNIHGSFLVEPIIGKERQGILFGTVDGKSVTVNLLSVRDSNLVTITFIDGEIVDEDTLRGTYYVTDSEGTSSSGTYVAVRQ